MRRPAGCDSHRLSFWTRLQYSPGPLTPFAARDGGASTRAATPRPAYRIRRTRCAHRRLLSLLPTRGRVWAMPRDSCSAASPLAAVCSLAAKRCAASSTSSARALTPSALRPPLPSCQRSSTAEQHTAEQSAAPARSRVRAAGPARTAGPAGAAEAARLPRVQPRQPQRAHVREAQRWRLVLRTAVWIRAAAAVHGRMKPSGGARICPALLPSRRCWRSQIRRRGPLS